MHACMLMAQVLNFDLKQWTQNWKPYLGLRFIVVSGDFAKKNYPDNFMFLLQCYVCRFTEQTQLEAELCQC